MEVVRAPMIPLPMPPKLRFNITPEVKKDIESAKQNMNMQVESVCVPSSFHSNISLKCFSLFGYSFIHQNVT